MMTTVFIPLTCENYHFEPFDNSSLRGEVSRWVVANVKGYWNWEAEHNRNGWQLAFRFENPEEAMQFKLTWK